MRKVMLELSGLSLTMKGPNGNETLEIRNDDYPQNPLSHFLFSQLGLMHLVAPYLPEVIETNFVVDLRTRGLIQAMYASEGKSCLKFVSPRGTFSFKLPKISPDKVTVAYSAGKDSLWNMWWARERYGPDNAFPVHIAGLNRSNAPGERTYAKLQAERLRFKNYRMIDLRNGSIETGFKVMRSRDIFLAGLIVPVAAELGAGKVIIEGFAEGASDGLFTSKERNMVRFNRWLKSFGIPAQVAWRNRKEMDVIKDLVANCPDWLPLVHNCFSPANYKVSLRKSWAGKTPTLPLYDSQCGSCIKCRMIRLSLILYRENGTTREDAVAFLKHTKSWIPGKWKTHRDMLEGSFMDAFVRACKKYGVDPRLATLR